MDCYSEYRSEDRDRCPGWWQLNQVPSLLHRYRARWNSWHAEQDRCWQRVLQLRPPSIPWKECRYSLWWHFPEEALRISRQTLPCDCLESCGLPHSLPPIPLTSSLDNQRWYVKARDCLRVPYSLEGIQERTANGTHDVCHLQEVPSVQTFEHISYRVNGNSQQESLTWLPLSPLD